VDPYLDILGQRIRARRREINMSQEKLAHEASLDRSYVGRIERGEHNPTFTALIKLCRAMECDLAALTVGLPTTKSKRPD
jgi:transcriptional regulator with XRE-family HTH domain